MNKNELKKDVNRLIKYLETYSKIPDNINYSRVEFSIGGQIMLRGFYCPSLIDDLVIGNVSRGRLVKSIPKNMDNYYKYYFDQLNRLVKVEKFSFNIIDTEYIYYVGNVAIGITFNCNKTIDRITECIYNEYGLVKDYTYVDLLSYKIALSIHRQENIFENNSLIATIKFDLSISYNLVVIYKYNFYLDEEGNIAYYSYQKQLNEEKPTIDNNIYCVNKKRKLTGEKNMKLNFKDYLFNKVYNIIQRWDDANVYAISFFIHTNESSDNIPEFYISYNTEEACNHSDDLSEERWNYAFWLQNEEEVIADDESYSLMMKWFKEKGIKNVGYEDMDNAYDIYMHYIGMGPNGLYELIQLIVEVAKDIHSSGIIKTKFGKELPIIIHDLEYSWYEIEATKNANPNGEADIFLKAAHEIGIY